MGFWSAASRLQGSSFGVVVVEIDRLFRVLDTSTMIRKMV
jgi:hypothetical protein